MNKEDKQMAKAKEILNRVREGGFFTPIEFKFYKMVLNPHFTKARAQAEWKDSLVIHLGETLIHFSGNLYFYKS